jgi:phosphate transport system permease protein
MSAPSAPAPNPTSGLPHGEALQQIIAQRRRRGLLWRWAFFSSLAIGIIALITLFYTIVNDSIGLVIIENKVDPATLSTQPLDQLSKDELVAALKSKVSAGRFRQLNREEAFEQRTQEEVLILLYQEVVKPSVVESHTLTDSIFNRARIEAEAAKQYPQGKIEFKSWLSADYLTTPMNSNPALAGVRTAILGSLLVVALTMLIAVPIGIGAAIYLEEYAGQSWFNHFIETNINNLAGVPSIIYGLLGLAVFVRALERFTSGAFAGVTDTNGRTVISAALTMALLILPLIIINAREAIRAVPQSLRQASYGLGATKWQTVWHHVLPNALPGILTGTILGMSRAIGESAPLIVVGASTFIVFDPSGPFSKFTVLPIQIYNWVQQPGEQFRNIAAAAILVLLAMLLALNATAILLRNYYRRSY